MLRFIKELIAKRNSKIEWLKNKPEYEKQLLQVISNAKQRGFNDIKSPIDYWKELDSKKQSELICFLASLNYRVYYYRGEQRITWHHHNIRSG